MFHKFFIDPRPVTLHTVFEKKIASTQRAGVGKVRLVIDVRSSQCHLTLKHSQFLNKIQKIRSSDGCTLGRLREREIVTGEIKLLIR